MEKSFYGGYEGFLNPSENLGKMKEYDAKKRWPARLIYLFTFQNFFLPVPTEI